MSEMSPVAAANIIRDQMKADPDLSRSLAAMIHRTGATDIYQWCENNPAEALALAEQLVDIEGQISNMSYLLARGDAPVALAEAVMTVLSLPAQQVQEDMARIAARHSVEGFAGNWQGVLRTC